MTHRIVSTRHGKYQKCIPRIQFHSRNVVIADGAKVNRRHSSHAEPYRRDYSNDMIARSKFDYLMRKAQ